MCGAGAFLSLSRDGRIAPFALRFACITPTSAKTHDRVRGARHMADQSYYDMLGVARDADEKALKSAFRKLAMKYHPDQNPGDAAAEQKFKDLNEAYSVLSDPQKRAAYDRFGKEGLNGLGGGGPSQADMSDALNEMFGDVFSEFFGQGGRRQRSGPARGADLRYDLEISLEDAFAGKDAEIRIPSMEPCGTCDGTGVEPGGRVETCSMCGGAGRVRASQGFFTMERTCPQCGGSGKMILDPCQTCGGSGAIRKDRTLKVNVPAGISDGQRIRLQGEGELGGRGGPRGDLYIFVSIRPHDIFERDGAELWCRAPVPMTVAALGGHVDIPTLDGEIESLKVPEGSQTGRRLRLRGKGMPVLNRAAQHGDLHVELYVETPRNLSTKQKKLLEEFAEGCAGDAHPESQSFFDRVKSAFDR